MLWKCIKYGYIFHVDLHTHYSGVARNFERGVPNDRAGGLGGLKNFEFYTENACKNSVYK